MRDSQAAARHGTAPDITEPIPGFSARTVGRPPRASLGQSIADTLREAIVSGAIPAGEQLKQDALSADFDVSPAPVREALRQLESEGLAEHSLNRGMFVSDLSEDEALKLLLPIRFIVENYAMQQIANQVSPALHKELEKQIQVMREGADAHDVAVINAADARFHQLAIEASGSRHSVQLWRSILPRIRMQFAQLTPRQATLHRVAEEHEELLHALEHGDSDELRSTLREHILGVSARLMGREDIQD